MTSRVKNVRVLALLAAAGMIMAACSSSSSGNTSSATALTSGSVSALAAANEATAKFGVPAGGEGQEHRHCLSEHGGQQ
jgi:uncharacterized protein YggE